MRIKVGRYAIAAILPTMMVLSAAAPAAYTFETCQRACYASAQCGSGFAWDCNAQDRRQMQVCVDNCRRLFRR
jgi:hypothetical protein